MNWKLVKQMDVRGIRIGFVFIKATRDANYVDPQFERNWKNSKKAGLIRGAYHYFNPLLSGKLQAKHFINTVKRQAGDLPPVLDIEDVKGISKERREYI